MTTVSRKFWAVMTTVGFSAFWLFAAFAVGGVVTGHGLDPNMVGLAAIGLALGADARARVERLTRDLAIGRHVRQGDPQQA
ncbi:MAG: hypothetical protein KF887_04850 [Paracoccaceae bacterium]|nr:MAG: hypothetical protein KF887_04850 [Paracoccaceae bacterium]